MKKSDLKKKQMKRKRNRHKCDCHKHEHQVCDVCQGVDGTEKDVPLTELKKTKQGDRKDGLKCSVKNAMLNY